MGNWLSLVFVAVIVGAVACFRLVRKSINRKAAQSGEDKRRVHKAVESLLATGGNFQTLYAHWEKKESYARAVWTTYYRYMVAYQGDALYVIPLHIDKKTREIQPGQPSVFSPENLGKVTVKTKQKDGAVEHIEIWLGNKQGEKLFELYVDAENLRKSRWYLVNIVQQEECAAFERFISSLAQRVAAENPGVDDLIKKSVNEGKGIIGAGVSIVGAVFAFFFPPAGIVLSLIGLLLCIVSKLKGANSKKPLIISIICTIWSAGFLWLFFAIFV